MAMTGQRSALERIRLFAGLRPVVIHKLEAVARPLACADGQLIVLEGDVDAPVFFVIEGTVRVFHTNPEGREQTLIYLPPGSVFNLSAVFSEERAAPSSVMAVGAARLLVIDPPDFRRVASETPKIALAVLRELSNKLRHLTALTHDLSLRNVRGRLARFLLLQSRAPATPAVRWTQEEIAAQLGTVREVVSRTLRAFVKEGVIKMERQHISALDLEALERDAEL